MGQFAVILAAAGRSTRFGDPKQKKIYAELEGRAVWLRALDPFLTHGEVEQIIVAIAPEDRELFDRRYHDKAAFLNLDVIDGGAERSDTVARALERVRPVCQFVAIHDAARPCLTENMVSAVFSAARDHGAALLATPVSDTIKRTGDDRFTTETVPRRNLYLAQTPQVFRRDWLEAAYARRAASRRRRHRRHPACRGSRASLRHRARVTAQSQAHDAGGPQARRGHPAPAIEQPTRDLRPSVCRRGRDVGRPAQPQGIGSLRFLNRCPDAELFSLSSWVHRVAARGLAPWHRPRGGSPWL